MSLEWPAAKVRSTFLEFFQAKEEIAGDGGHSHYPSCGKPYSGLIKSDNTDMISPPQLITPP